MKDKIINYIIKHLPICIGGVAGLLLIVIIIALVSTKDTQETVYRETEAVRGDLTVGISESGTVDIGTIDQELELDISALVRNSSTGSSSGSNNSNNSQGMGGAMGGGMDMFSQIFDFASQGNNEQTTTDSSDLEVAEVVVSVGQQVKEGDTLYILTEESVSEIKERLESDVEKAYADLESVYAQQKQSKLSAQHNYDSSVAYGSYAQTEYNTTISNLENAVTTKEKELEIAKQELEVYESRLTQAKEDLEAANQAYANATWSANSINKNEGTYLYTQYESLKTQAKSSVSTLERTVEELENNVEKSQSSISTLESEVKKAKRDLALGKLTARETFDLRNLALNTAEETYDIAISYLEEDAAEQEETYADAKERWEQFTSQIEGNAICAQYSGVVTDVYLEVGDTLNTGSSLITLYDLDEVSMTVSVSSDDMTDIYEGAAANIVFTAYPDEVFTGVVTEISDAVTSSSGSVGYSVTVTLQGDVSGLYQGMTGEITFITKETKEVLYVSNRAITRKGNKSYVKVKDSNGNTKTQEVTTGFSDGVNVEIKEGLSEGDIVLIESKVTN